MKILQILLILLLCGPAYAIQIVDLPAIGTPTSATDAFVTFDSSEAIESRLTKQTFSGIVDEFLNGQGSWIKIIPAAGGTFTGSVTFTTLTSAGVDGDNGIVFGNNTSYTPDASENSAYFEDNLFTVSENGTERYVPSHTISTSAPSGGNSGDIWYVIP